MAGMEDERDIAEVARMMIRSFGDRAVAIMDRRAEDHIRAGEAEGADFWRRVAHAIREIEASLPEPEREAADHPSPKGRLAPGGPADGQRPG
jgi:hypothetical protein